MASGPAGNRTKHQVFAVRGFAQAFGQRHRGYTWAGDHADSSGFDLKAISSIRLSGIKHLMLDLKATIELAWLNPVAQIA